MSLSRTFMERRRYIRRTMNALKSKPCLDCGHSFLPCVMEFDHRDASEKEHDVAYLIGGGAALQRILREAEKCDLVCANCHRVRTWERAKGKRTIAAKNEPQLSLLEIA